MAPPKRDTHGIMLRLPNEMIRQLEALSLKEEDTPSLQDMIRRILTEYLKAKNG